VPEPTFGRVASVNQSVIDEHRNSAVAVRSNDVLTLAVKRHFDGAAASCALKLAHGRRLYPGRFPD
jgi:hypothetical protein